MFDEKKLMRVIDETERKIEIKNNEHHRKEKGDRGKHIESGQQSHYADRQGGEKQNGNPAQSLGFIVGKIVIHLETKPFVTLEKQGGIIHQHQGIQS